MDRHRAANHALWDARAEGHAQSDFYDLEGFKRGRSSLTRLERSGFGDVRGGSLLHLQCHFGQDTLSWAREGAVVTGVDFSERAIRLARSLSAELRLPARFLCCDVYDLPQRTEETFDFVFSSYGVLKWLSDIRAWGRIVANLLAPGGTFFLVEFHPFLYVFDYEKAERIEHEYFFCPQPIAYDEIGTYASPEQETVRRAYAWSHPVSDVISALLEAGLRLDEFCEYPYSEIGCFPFVEEQSFGVHVHRIHPGMFPLSYSIRARRES